MLWLQNLSWRTELHWGGVPAKKISNHNSHDFLAEGLLNEETDKK